MKKLLLLILPLICLCGFTHAKKPKEPELAQAVWFLMEQQEDKKRQPNDSVIIKFRIENEKRYGGGYGYVFYLPHVVISIQNNSERTIFVDLQNSFIVAGGENYPLFTNTTDVSTQGSTVAGGVGLGIIGVGSASSNFNTTIRQEQRIVTIPNDSKKDFEFPFITKWATTWKLDNGRGEFYMHPKTFNGGMDYPLLRQNFINKGEVLNYNYSDAPFKLDFRISYSFSEDITNASTDRTVFCTTYAIGSENKGSSVFTINDLDKDYKLAKDLFPKLEEFINNPQVLIVHMWSNYDYKKSL